MTEYTLYYKGRQIDSFYVASNDDAIEWVESNYTLNEFGEDCIMLYRNVNGASIHVARFAVDRGLPLSN
jgi:hypothetical protein